MTSNIRLKAKPDILVKADGKAHSLTLHHALHPQIYKAWETFLKEETLQTLSNHGLSDLLRIASSLGKAATLRSLTDGKRVWVAELIWPCPPNVSQGEDVRVFYVEHRDYLSAMQTMLKRACRVAQFSDS